LPDLGLEGAELRELMLEHARVLMVDGSTFGPEGEGFERINIACPRSILVEALGRIKDAIENLED
jgi:cystathionine beta-lyase